jgi:hypothetical protein
MILPLCAARPSASDGKAGQRQRQSSSASRLWNFIEILLAPFLRT